MDTLSFIQPRSGDYVDWSEAYARVENYFCSLRIENKLLLSQLVAKILTRAAQRLEKSPGSSPQKLAMEEARKEVLEWFESVLAAARVTSDQSGAKGRLALFLADMPSRWQNEFLHPGPWPDDFLNAFRTTYLKTRPDFQKGVMRPREIDLGPVSAIADETWKAIDRWPLLGTTLVWSMYLGLLGAFFYLTR